MKRVILTREGELTSSCLYQWWPVEIDVLDGAQASLAWLEIRRVIIGIWDNIEDDLVDEGLELEISSIIEDRL